MFRRRNPSCPACHAYRRVRSGSGPVPHLCKGASGRVVVFARGALPILRRCPVGAHTEMCFILPEQDDGA